EKTGLFLREANDRLKDPAFREELVRDHCMEPDTADELIQFLARQREATGADLPHRTHLLVERFHDTLEELGIPQLVFHTLWGGAVNRPLALALAQAYEDRHGRTLEVHSNDDLIVVAIGPEVTPAELLAMVTPESVEVLLRKRLERSGFFGARFRENAARAL